MIRPTTHLLSSCIASVLLMMATSYASAQDVAVPAAEEQDAPMTLESVTVTARGIAEPLQKMPLPITAISSDTIEKKGLDDVTDIAALTPSFSFRSGYGRGFDRPVIRGMSNIQGEPNASFFIDGVYVEGDISSYGLENIQRVEVIRGPQSAAFGRRTFSGAVNFITARPGTVRGGKVTLGAGNHGQEKMGLFYSGGNDDGTFGYDISVNKRGNDGIYFNEVSGDKDLGGTESLSVMGAIAWSPTDKLDITARVSKQETRDQHFAIARIGSENLNCFLPEFSGDLMFGVYPVLESRRRGYYCGDMPAPDSYGINTPELQAAGYFAGRKGDLLRTGLVADYHFDNGWKFTSTSAYNESDIYEGFDQDYSADRGYGGAFESFTNTRNSDWSQDFRLSSDESLPVSGLFGVYYYAQQGRPGWLGDLTGFTIGGPVSVSPVSTNPSDETINKAVYGMLNWRIDERWTASLEGRYASDEISQGGVDTRVLTGYPPPSYTPVDIVYSRPYALSETFESFTPRATLGYQAADNVNVYGLVSKGTKPGGFNVDVQRADLAEAGRDTLIARGLETFDEEEAWNYELGLKSDWLDNTLRLNANVYWIEWTNQQLTETQVVPRLNDSMLATSFTTNIGESRIRGLELEGQWAFAPGWLASFNYSYTDAEIINFISQNQADLFSDSPAPTLDDPAANAAGNQLPRVPKHKATLGFLYEGALANGWGWTANIDSTYEGRRYVQVDNLASIAPSVRTNMRFALDLSEKLQVAAYVTNAFNDRAPEDVQRTIDQEVIWYTPNVAPLTGTGFNHAVDFGITPSLPRMYGVEVSYRF
ncbi:TonB-dependent receptor [Lysobacter sp. A378]